LVGTYSQDMNSLEISSGEKDISCEIERIQNLLIDIDKQIEYAQAKRLCWQMHKTLLDRYSTALHSPNHAFLCSFPALIISPLGSCFEEAKNSLRLSMLRSKQIHSFYARLCHFFDLSNDGAPTVRPAFYYPLEQFSNMKIDVCAQIQTIPQQDYIVTPLDNTYLFDEENTEGLNATVSYIRNRSIGLLEHFNKQASGAAMVITISPLREKRKILLIIPVLP